MHMFGVGFSDTVGLGSLVIAVMLLAIAGFPLRVIQSMRVEREEMERSNKHKDDMIKERDQHVKQLEVALAECQSRTDLTKLSEEQREFHERSLQTMAKIAEAVEAQVDRIEAAVAGGLAAHTRELGKVATVLDRLIQEGGH